MNEIIQNQMPVDIFRNCENPTPFLLSPRIPLFCSPDDRKNC